MQIPQIPQIKISVSKPHFVIKLNNQHKRLIQTPILNQRCKIKMPFMTAKRHTDRIKISQCKTENIDKSKKLKTQGDQNFNCEFLEDNLETETQTKSVQIGRIKRQMKNLEYIQRKVFNKANLNMADQYRATELKPIKHTRVTSNTILPPIKLKQNPQDLQSLQVKMIECTNGMITFSPSQFKTKNV